MTTGLNCSHCGQELQSTKVIFDLIKVVQGMNLWLVDQDFEMNDGTVWNLKLRKLSKKRKQSSKK